MKCPKCESQMHPLKGAPFLAFRCQGCLGFWFPGGDDEVAKALDYAAIFDDAPTGANAGFDQNRDIDCPHCSEKMIPMADKNQFHVKYESCANCRGVFLDSGELLDLSEFSIVERIKQAISAFQSQRRPDKSV